MIVLIGTIALCVVSGCGASRSVTMRSSAELRTTESRSDTVREQVMVEVHDTLTITITKTIRENEQGDTIRLTTETERDRVRDRTGFKVQDSRVTVKRDTVYIERKDSVRVQESGFKGQGESRPSRLVQTLKWAFWVIIAIIGMIVLIRINGIRS